MMMTEELQTLLYIIVSLVSILLISHIAAIYVYRLHILKYEKAQLTRVTDYFIRLESLMFQSTENINEQIKLQSGLHAKMVGEIQVKNNDLISKLEIAYKGHTERLSLNFTAYAENVDKANRQLLDIIKKMEKSLFDYKEISKVLNSNYKELSLLSDKTKEIQASHETLLVQHKDQFSEMLNAIRSNANQKFTELVSDTELTFIKLHKEAIEGINEVSGKVIKNIESLMGNTAFKDFVKNVEVMKTKFDEQIQNVRGEIMELKSMEENIIQQLEETIKKKKSWFGLF